MSAPVTKDMNRNRHSPCKKRNTYTLRVAWLFLLVALIGFGPVSHSHRPSLANRRSSLCRCLRHPDDWAGSRSRSADLRGPVDPSGTLPSVCQSPSLPHKVQRGPPGPRPPHSHHHDCPLRHFRQDGAAEVPAGTQGRELRAQSLLRSRRAVADGRH